MKSSKAHAAYKLGVTAGTLLMGQPEGWRRKLKLNVSRAQKLGVKVQAEAFNDVVDINTNEKTGRI